MEEDTGFIFFVGTLGTALLLLGIGILMELYQQVGDAKEMLIAICTVLLGVAAVLAFIFVVGYTIVELPSHVRRWL